VITLNFKENLKKLRKEKNISQEQLAEKLDNLILLRDIFNVSLDELMVNEKTDKVKSTNQEEHVSSDNSDSYDEEDEDEDSVNLMLGGFIIGTGVGVITGNFMWGTAGAFIGLGIGYVLEVIRRKNKEKR